MTRYGFEIKEITLCELVEKWTASYSIYWIHLAIVESLYQGRYKAISVEHILALWKRLGHPSYHFTYEFERFITRNVFIEDINNHKITEQQPAEEKPSPSEAVCSTKPKNSITLTPIQELIKKIAIPLSLSSDKITSKTNHKPILNQVDAPPVQPENSATPQQDSHQQDLESHISLDPEKTSRPINQFVPSSDSSDFYGKLRAVAHQQLEENQET
ncbi:MAG: hypothetical protein AB4063_12890 [Crocosphaera sp.]